MKRYARNLQSYDDGLPLLSFLVNQTKLLDENKTIRMMNFSPLPPFIRGETETSLHILNTVALLDNVSFLDVFSFKSKKSNNNPQDLVLFNSNKIHAFRVLFFGKWISSFNGLLLSIFVKMKKYDIIYLINPFDHKYFGGIMGEGIFPLLLFSKLLNIPVVVAIHTPYLLDDLKESIRKRARFGLISMFLFSLEKVNMTIMFRLITKIFLPTYEDRNNDLIYKFKTDYKVPYEKVESEQLPFLLKGLLPVKPPEINEALTKKFALSFGFFREDKGFHLAVDAWQSNSDSLRGLKLLIVGPATDEDSIRYLKKINDKIQSYHLSNDIIVIPKFFKLEELLWITQNSLFIIMPYLRLNGPSGTAIFASSAGVPIVATRLPALELQLRNSATTWCDKNVSDLSRAILKQLT